MDSFNALVLSLPTRNSTLRMRVWRGLKETGCGVLRDGVYLLPASAIDGTVLARMESEIRSNGGFAMTLELKAASTGQFAELRKLFDRLASAWLIKRFIDREARFAWIARPSECPKKAVGFDFDGAEFTHVKNRVTFEVLLASFGLDGDSALAAIGASVHYLDVGGIPVADAKGLETVLKGIKEKARDDDALLAEAMRILDLFYSAYRQDKKDSSGRSTSRA